ncbi:V-type ATP synthase subunit F [Ferroplasma sp.]|uniref:V-type ATP synthase subunit F n=1 Tax=Ferroplasma sp. TaxID=2591003 RepID=UPI00307E1A8B
MNELCLIGERELVTGFKLVGINDAFISEPENGITELKQLFNSRKYNVIMVSQSFEKYMSDDELKLYTESMDPLVIFIPLPGIKEEESIYDMAKKILGIDIGD